MAGPNELLALTERIAEAARRLGVETALIGATALAVRGYERATKDLDLATVIDPYPKLQELEVAVQALGLRTKLNMPDDEDDLGGVLNIGTELDEDGELVTSLQIVNFNNPMRPRKNPARDAIARATPIEPSSPLRCVQLDDLIALKIDAGSRQDLADVVALIARNEDADLDRIRATCAPYGFTEIVETLIAEALLQRR
ncbi:MAG TPA: nucleotidyl transferase AbiEii/AbiGii toxin family protein [Kofleriaceae bacterium]